MFGAAPLMGGDGERIANDIFDGLFQIIEIPAAGIGFIARHQAGPLVVAHRAGSAVGQKINVDIFSLKGKRIISGRLQGLDSFFLRNQPDRFDHFNSERFGSTHQKFWHIESEANGSQTRLTDFSLKNLGLEKVTQELRHLSGFPIIFINLTSGDHYPAKRNLPAGLSADGLYRILAAEKSPQTIVRKINQADYFIHPIVSGTINLGCLLFCSNGL